MPARLRRGPSAVECEPSLDPYTVKRPYSLALRDALEGRAASAAARLHLSARLVEAWGNACDPQRSPLQVLDELLAALLALGARPAELEPAVALLARRIGRDLVPLPEALRESVTAAVAEAAREVGEGLAVALAVAEDGEVDELEVARARRELAEIRDRTGRLEAALDRAHQETVRRRQSSRAGNK